MCSHATSVWGCALRSVFSTAIKTGLSSDSLDHVLVPGPRASCRVLGRYSNAEDSQLLEPAQSWLLRIAAVYLAGALSVRGKHVSLFSRFSRCRICAFSVENHGGWRFQVSFFFLSFDTSESASESACVVAAFYDSHRRIFVAH